MICGKEMESRHWRAKYCAECKKRIKRERDQEYRRRYRRSEKRQDLGKQGIVSMATDIEQLVRKAREAGMSYGKYIATRGIV